MAVRSRHSAPIVRPAKARDIGLKQLKALANLGLDNRIAIIAEGMPIIFRSMEGLAAAASALKGHLRATEILDRHAQEEAAKILILLDYLRCPPNRSDLAQTRLAAFYDHGSRLIYAEACRWKAWDIDMLRGYVDQTRASHYVEGDFAEWIMPNWEVYVRESILYADLGRSVSGCLSWSDPHTWDAVQGSIADSGIGTKPVVSELVRALSRLGFFRAEALVLIHNIWSPHPFILGPEGMETANSLMEQTISALVDGKLVTDSARQEDVGTVYNSWQLPMYGIEMRLREISLETLQAEQASQSRSAIA